MLGLACWALMSTDESALLLIRIGQSYERSAICEHLKKLGDVDPITRSVVKVEQLVPNLALRSAVQRYLQEHPWAWAECR